MLQGHLVDLHTTLRVESVVQRKARQRRVIPNAFLLACRLTAASAGPLPSLSPSTSLRPSISFSLFSSLIGLTAHQKHTPVQLPRSNHNEMVNLSV